MEKGGETGQCQGRPVEAKPWITQQQGHAQGHQQQPLKPVCPDGWQQQKRQQLEIPDPGANRQKGKDHGRPNQNQTQSQALGAVQGGQPAARHPAPQGKKQSGHQL